MKIIHSFKTILLILLSLSFFKVTASTSAGDKSRKKDKPNILLFFVDDLGWADLGYRNPVFHTPNIDQLMKEGMDFSRAYIATPTSSPSRASLLTGKEPVRLRMVRHIPEGEKYGFDAEGRTREPFHLWDGDPARMPSRNWLPLEEITYAERLKEAGYYNVHVGKWHLGSEEFHPVRQGFDEQLGTSNYGHPKSYYQPYFIPLNPLADASKDAYLTDVLTEMTEQFITSYDKDKPFLISLWYYNVHGPFVGRKDLVEKYKKEGLEGRYAEYAAQVSAVDESVGRIRKALKEKGLDENTVILFLSDQGGFFENGPLSGGKIGGNTLGEGGARVPFIVYYPNITKGGSTCDVPVQSIDIYPTLIEIASGEKCKDKGINGVSLLPLLKGGKIKDRNLYFFRSYEDQYAAVIQVDWKLKAYHSGKFELYNLRDDIGEHNNLIDSSVRIANRLKAELAKWEKEVLADDN